MSEKIAVIGMGQMGSNMASRLGEAQFDVMGYDIAERVRKNLSERGVKMGAGLADCVSFGWVFYLPCLCQNSAGASLEIAGFSGSQSFADCLKHERYASGRMYS